MTQTPGSPPTAARFNSLTSLRALAALMVFVHHLGGARLIDFPPAKAGFAGVAFFFVLSGFVLTWGHSPSDAVRWFYVRRAARILPNYYAVFVVALLLPVAGQRDPLTAVTNALLLQAWVPMRDWVLSVNGVSWSLSVELAFYAAFPLIVPWLTRASIRQVWIVTLTLLVLVGGAMGLGAGASSDMIDTILHHDPLVRAPEFLLGAALATTLKRGHIIPWWVLGATVVVTAAGAALLHSGATINVWVALLSACVITVVVRREQRGLTRILGWRPLVAAGNISFAFYLVHQLVIANLLEGTDMPDAATAILAFVIAAVISSLMYYQLELRANRTVVRRFAGERAAANTRPLPT